MILYQLATAKNPIEILEKIKKGEKQMISYVGKKVLARGIQSGVYFGELVDRVGQEVELKNVRNLWKWHGANTLLDVAENGVVPDGCNISNFVESLVLTDICEIVPCSSRAISNIEEVSSWIFQK